MWLTSRTQVGGSVSTFPSIGKYVVHHVRLTRSYTKCYGCRGIIFSTADLMIIAWSRDLANGFPILIRI